MTKYKNRSELDLSLFPEKTMLVGLDEVGWGTIAGPLVIGSCFLDKSFFNDNLDIKILELVKDSKKTTVKNRLKVIEYFNNLSSNKLTISFGVADVDYINKNGLARAYDFCLEQIFENSPQVDYGLILDGSREPDFIKKLPIAKTIIKKADDLSFTVALASIFAKNHRDSLMSKLENEYPGYGLEKNKGYGTAEHISALKNLGLSPIHRQKACQTILS